MAGWDVHLSWVVTGVAGSVAIGAANYFGIRFAAFVQRLAVASLLLIGLAFFLPGTVRGDAANLAPYITGWEGVLRVVIMTPFLYVGFDVIPQLAEEIDVPKRTVGRVIVLSILMALGWYVLVQWTVGLSLDPVTLGDRTLPTADAMSAVYGSPWAGRVLVVGGAFGILTSWNAFFLGASRLLFAMARGGMLPAVFTRLHPRHGSPVAVVVLLTAVSALAPFFGRPALVWLVDAGSLATVVAYLLVAASFLVIRRRHPDPAPSVPCRRPDAGRLAGGRGHAVLPRALSTGQPVGARMAAGVGDRAAVDSPRRRARAGDAAPRGSSRRRTAGPAHPGGVRGRTAGGPRGVFWSAHVTRRRLPIGIQTFRTIREEGCYYVDKTAHVRRLLDEGTHYFLSRPRRFGKSLFLDTLKELFEGNEPLFAGLAIHDDWDWSVRHPVLRLSFGSGNFDEPGHVATSLMAQLDAVERESGVASDYRTGPQRFAHLLESLHRRTGQRVAVLVDEYDKPILDALEAPETARANRDYLRGLYAVVKDSDAHVRFAFLTGVTRFSKVNLFSGLNNLKDITLDPRYSDICGYTEADLDAVFSPELPGLDRQRIRDWYNGYGWRGTEKVYNPFDILLLFDRREFDAYWFESATPTFLVEALVRRRVSSLTLEDMLSSSELLSAFDVGAIATEALLFQTGYLTIKGSERLGSETLYRLGYPNLEVRQSLNRSLLRHLVQDATRQTANSARLYRLLEADDFAGLEALFQGVLRQHSLRVVHQQRDRRLRGLLRERLLFLFPRPWGWTSRSRTRPATGGRTWRCGSAAGSTCSSSRWWSLRGRARPWRN